MCGRVISAKDIILLIFELNFNYMRIIFPYYKFAEGTPAMNRVLAYAKAMGSLGHEVHVVFFFGDSNVLNPLKDLTQYITIHTLCEVGDWGKDSKLLAFAFALIKFSHFLKKGDCVFVYENGSALSIILAALFRPVRVFCEMTEHPDIYKRRRRQISHYVYKNTLLCCLRHMDGVFVISKHLQLYIQAQGVKQVHISNMFVDFSRFGNTKPILNDEPVIAYCGTVSKRKDGVDILIQAFQLFATTHPKYKLMIIGPMQYEGLQNELQQLCRDQQIWKRIFFTGKVSADDMPALLCKANILALARPDSLQAQNGFPTKLGEYLATGRPAVVTKVGDIPMFLEDKVSAFLVEPNNIQAFADALTCAADNETLSTKVGIEGRKVAMQHFNAVSESKKVLSYMLRLK